jgi:hypothetical protein
MVFYFPTCHFVLYKLPTDVYFNVCHCVLKCFIISTFLPFPSKMPEMLDKTSQNVEILDMG